MSESEKQRPEEGLPVGEPNNAPPHELEVERDDRDDNEIADERVQVIKRPGEERSG